MIYLDDCYFYKGLIGFICFRFAKTYPFNLPAP